MDDVGGSGGGFGDGDTWGMTGSWAKCTSGLGQDWD